MIKKKNSLGAKLKLSHNWGVKILFIPFIFLLICSILFSYKFKLGSSQCPVQPLS